MPATKQQLKYLKALGERIRDLREKRELTQKEMAYSIGKDPQSISRLEQGQVNPGYLYLLQVCEALEISLVDLMKGVQG